MTVLTAVALLVVGLVGAALVHRHELRSRFEAVRWHEKAALKAKVSAALEAAVVREDA